MQTACLSTAYLAPVCYYAQLLHNDLVLVEQHEHYIKQTYRNRANIATTNGVMPLTIPVEHAKGGKTLMRDLRMSNHGHWRHLHWQALVSAYDRSPFFEYYADDIRPFYEEEKTSYLLEFNLKLQETICSLLNLKTNINLTTEYKAEGDFLDLRNAITPKGQGKNSGLIVQNPQPYYQVFAQRHGFLANLSIVDLLFNMGPEALVVLHDMTTPSAIEPFAT